MISRFDIFIITSVGIGFLSFLGIHFLTFPLIKRNQVLTYLVKMFGVGLVVLIGVMFWLISYVEQWLRLQAESVVGLCVMSGICVYAMLSFLYVLAVFGPYESSIRIRLIRELYEHPEGLSWKQILQQYNSCMILTIRLERLLSSGDILYDGQCYKLKRKGNIFCWLEFGSEFLRKIYH